jgi:beta-glucosidase
VEVSIDVSNTGNRGGDEVVQAYIRPVKPRYEVPLYQLVQFQRVHIAKGAVATVKLTLAPEAFSVVTPDGARIAEPGAYDLYLAGCLPSMPGANSRKITITLAGDTVRLAGAF